jgi:hypothetical protein
MHISSKDVDQDGVHIITSQIESDGPNALCSDKATFEASVISKQRTESGGVKVQVSLRIVEPAAEPAKEAEAPKPQPSAAEQASAYLEAKGSSKEEAAASVERFGADKILAKRQEELDAELDALLSKAE